MNIISLTLIDLTANIGKTPDDVAYTMFLRSGSYLVGALCSITFIIHSCFLFHEMENIKAFYEGWDTNLESFFSSLIFR